MNPSVKCVRPDYCFVSYLDDAFTPTDFTALYVQAVETPGVDSENVKFKQIPAITAVSVIVRGEYGENLPKGYAFAAKWVEENGYEIADKFREVYIDGVWNRDNPDDYITEIQIPIQK